MAVLLTLTVGLVWWITAWALLGIKAFDAFMVTVFLVVIAATAHLYGPYVRQALGRD